MKRFAFVLCCCTALTSVGAAQKSSPAANPGVSANRQVWSQLSGFVLASAEQMPEADFAFAPTSGVRTFGQIVAHVAGSQYAFCGAALGQPTEESDTIEKTKTTKADIVAVMRASNEFCAKAYAQTDAAASKTVKMFGENHTRMWALALNASHDGEHYGNLVTYLRIKGMVPPSSRPNP